MSSVCYKPYLDKLNVDESFSLKPKQLEILGLIREGEQQVVGILPTGYGKSIIYQILPFLLRGAVIVFSPLSSIMYEQVGKLSTTELNCCILDTRGRVMTNVEYNEVGTEILDIKSSVPLPEIRKCNLIFCHPEALFSTYEGKQLLDSDRSSVKAVVIDECHKVCDWGESFRKAFACIKEIPAFFQKVTRLALSATITLDREKEVLQSLGMASPKIVRENPDRINIFLEKKCKATFVDIYESYESIYKPLCDDLLKSGSKFPVTLLYMPLEHIGSASAYCNYIFKGSTLENSLYACICSGQDDLVKTTVLSELGKTCPRIRLVFCTSMIGMGFNSPSITRVIHSKPPRNLPDYVQEFGRAGRYGQPSEAILYYCKRDIASNVKNMRKDMIDYCNEEHCLRSYLLKQFGFEKDIQNMHDCCSYCKNVCTCFECQIFNIEL